jgi:lysine 2,3-aminomutase
LKKLRSIEQIKSVRIHTRIPAVFPDRVNRDLLEQLHQFEPCWIVTHFNHPNELTDSAREALAKFADNGFPLLNQSVLLKGVNDDVSILTKLCRLLIVNRVKPYYIHLLDPAIGVCHFKVSSDVAVTFSAEMQARLPGYGVPLFVRDHPSMSGKQVLK